VVENSLVKTVLSESRQPTTSRSEDETLFSANSYWTHIANRSHMRVYDKPDEPDNESENKIDFTMHTAYAD